MQTIAVAFTGEPKILHEFAILPGAGGPTYVDRGYITSQSYDIDINQSWCKKIIHVYNSLASISSKINMEKAHRLVWWERHTV